MLRSVDKRNNPLAAIRRCVSVGVLSHLLTLLFFTLVFYSLISFLPSSTPAGDLESSIQLLTQVLALVIGVLLLGTTVYLASYDISDSLISIHGDIETISGPIFDRFFSITHNRHKIRNERFRRFLFRRVGVTELVFRERANSECRTHFIYRPYWDGVWYQAFYSPFKTDERKDQDVVRIQATHELVICARRTLAIVQNLRRDGAALLSRQSGTQGSKLFIQALEAQPSLDYDELPDTLSLTDAARAVELAVESTHYMQEELNEHAENLNWEPNRLSRFQLAFVDYVLWLTYLVMKFENCRMSNAIVRFPSMVDRLDKIMQVLVSQEIVANAKQKIHDIRKRVVTAHGVARYFADLKRVSVPGIGMAIVALIMVLISWPFIKSSVSDCARLIGFTGLYAFGMAALAESCLFVGRMLWTKRPASGRRRPFV